MTHVHPSKVDAWLLIVLIAAMGLSLFTAFQLLFAEPALSWWPLLLTLGVGFGLPLWLLLGTRYVLDNSQLTIRGGPFRWKIPLQDITGMTPTRNPLASPALSLDRLRIEYGQGKAIMISPRDQERFIRDVENLRRDVR